MKRKIITALLLITMVTLAGAQTQIAYKQTFQLFQNYGPGVGGTLRVNQPGSFINPVYCDLSPLLTPAIDTIFRCYTTSGASRITFEVKNLDDKAVIELQIKTATSTSPIKTIKLLPGRTSGLVDARSVSFVTAKLTCTTDEALIPFEDAEAELTVFTLQ